MASLSPRKIGCVAAFLGTLVAAQDAADNPERQLTRLKRQTVMITVTLRDGTMEHGAGVVLCQKSGRGHVLTTYRVLAGEMPGVRRSLRRPARTVIRFYDDTIPAVIDDRATGKRVVTFQQMPDQGLVLLSFSLRSKLKATATLGRPIRREQEGDQVIFTVGYRKSSMETWAEERGTLLTEDDRFLRHSVPVADGFFGGPVFNHEGALIAINTERVARQAQGEEASGWYGQALSVEEVLPAIDKWVPARCLRASSLKETFAEFRLNAKGRARETLPQILRAEAEKMRVKGRESFSEKIRFGSYQVTHLKRGVLTEGSRTKQQYAFSLAGTGGGPWDGECTVGAQRRQAPTEPGPDIRLELGEKPSLACSFNSHDGEMIESILITDPADPNSPPSATARHSHIRAERVGMRFYGARKSQPMHEFGYAFFEEDRALGAVTLTRGGAVWLHPSVTGKTRTACVLASAAILLNPD